MIPGFVQRSTETEAARGKATTRDLNGQLEFGKEADLLLDRVATVGLELTMDEVETIVSGVKVSSIFSFSFVFPKFFFEEIVFPKCLFGIWID